MASELEKTARVPENGEAIGNTRVIFIRHGQYNPYTKSLDEIGCQQTQLLGVKLQALIGDRKVQILSSTAARAKETAGILGDIFGVEIEETGTLVDDDDDLRHLEEARQCIMLAIGNKPGAITFVVTHVHFVETLPAYLGEKDLDVPNIPKQLVGYNGCVSLDFQTKTLKILQY